MQAMRLLLVVTAVLGVAGCKTAPEPAKEVETNTMPVLLAEPTRPKVEVLASISREACFGKCPVYSATVMTDGTVSFDGKHYTDAPGPQNTKLEADQLQALITRFETSGFNDWSTSYVRHYVTDMAYVTLSFRGKSIRHYLGDDQAPVELKTLEDDAPALMGVAGFIKGGVAQ